MEYAVTPNPFELNPSHSRCPRPQEKGRDPYDGLRPWSAITHGVGAVLALVGTVLSWCRQPYRVPIPGSWCPSPSTARP